MAPAIIDYFQASHKNISKNIFCF